MLHWQLSGWGSPQGASQTIDAAACAGAVPPTSYELLLVQLPSDLRTSPVAAPVAALAAALVALAAALAANVLPPCLVE